jgi:hypothetical protein
MVANIHKPNLTLCSIHTNPNHNLAATQTDLSAILFLFSLCMLVQTWASVNAISYIKNSVRCDKKATLVQTFVL